ncbi:hypothetical protein B0H14DRAFT_288061 [Mycena olivaceomarginata]|nr:hypothetical protein B0H14DRAFT_288061 [Mycena olivaceomarginata]
MQRLSDSKIRPSVTGSVPIHTIRCWCGIFVALVALRTSGSKNNDLGRRERRGRALSLTLGAGAMGKVRATGRARGRREWVVDVRQGERASGQGRAGERRRNRCARWVERRLRGWETEEPGARAPNPAPHTTLPAHEHPIVDLRASFIRLVESPPLTRPSHTRNWRRRRSPPVAEQARRTVRRRKRESIARMVHDAHGAIRGWIWIRTSTVLRERRVCRDGRAPRR